MAYFVHLGEEEQELLDGWEAEVQDGTASKRTRGLLKKILRVIGYLETNPYYQRLNTHEITSLTVREGFPIYCSYVEERIPGAYRALWAFNPGDEDEHLSILAIIPHPKKTKDYARVKLSDVPNINDQDDE